MNEEIVHRLTYQKDFFDRLKKSIRIKCNEECFSAVMKGAFWWIIDKDNPKQNDVKALFDAKCPQLKKYSDENFIKFSSKMSQSIKKCAEDRKFTRVEYDDILHGFVYPVIQSDRILGFIGAYYFYNDISTEIFTILPSFTDILVKEAEKDIELAKLYETLRPRAIALSTVHTVHRLINSTLDLTELLPRIARLSLQVMRANRCSIKLMDYKRKILLPKTTIDMRENKIKLKKVKVGMWAPGKAVKFGRPIRGRDYLATPLIDEDVIGVITLYDKIDNKPFTSFDQEIMATLAEQAVIAIKNAQLYKEQERLTMGTIKALAKVLDTRSPGTYVPRASFVKIALALGQEMRMDGEALKSLEYASILHDAGEIFVPQDVLAKPSKLTGKEYEIIKGHPAAGVEIIKHMKALKSATPIIMHHHENYDGTGYPKGIKKDQIPLGARIMSVVSSFEAMLSIKPYRPAMTIESAINEIKKNSGTQFDPKIVEAFLKIIRRRDLRLLIEREMYGSG